MKTVRSLTTKRKPLFCMALLFLLAALVLTSCASKDDYTTETDEAGYPENDYGKHLYGESYDSETDGEVSIESCYGIYNGCVPVMFSQIAFTVITDVQVEGINFHYRSSNTIKVWKDGTFYSIQEAYDQGFLTKEQIQTIADMHNNGQYKVIK